jgi:hypothetical protein
VLPRLVIAAGTLEALKWLGLVLMSVDHVNKYLFNGTNAAAFAMGRLALPVFAFVLAYNLARAGILARGVYLRTAIRLLVFGLLATPPFIALGGLIGGVYPLNIMFTLLVATAVIFLVDSGRMVTAILVFAAGGVLVEFWWPALGLCVAMWLFAQSPNRSNLLLVIACCAGLQVVNGNAWALAALPIILSASYWKLTARRWRWLFYAYYPAHLTALWLLRIPMKKAGYLFF